MPISTGPHVAHADVHGKLLGGHFKCRPVAGATGVHPDGPGVQRRLGGDALHSALGLPQASRSAYDRLARCPPSGIEPVRERSLRINGSLAGLELNLPEPLAKPAGTAAASTSRFMARRRGPQLRVTLGSVLRGQVNIESGANGPTLGRAAVTFGGEGPSIRP